MSLNYMVFIRDDNHLSPEVRHITVFAENEDHAQTLAEKAAEAMCEDFHKGRQFYVDSVVLLE